MKITKQKIILCVALLLLAVCLVGFLLNGNQKEPDHSNVGRSLTKELVLFVFDDTIETVKNELKLAVQDILEENPESARLRIGTVSEEIKNLHKPLEQGIAILKPIVPSKAKRLEDVQVLLNAADMGLKEILLPAIDVIEAYPISQMKVGEGFNTKLLGQYLDFAESRMPQIEEVLELVNSVDLSFLDGKMTAYLRYLEVANKAMDFYRSDPSIVPMLKSMLGCDEDRLYVVAVQNPAEIRASGGFPGSVGTMRITDGVLIMEDFRSVTYMFSASTPMGIRITAEEWEMFRHLSGIQTPRDADLCPDFERVGHIWALAYEEAKLEHVDGVISVSPHIVQRLLNAMGEQIELFDGTVLNGDNALKVLIHDIYFKYFSTNYVTGRERISDELFAEAAKKTMEKLTGEVSATQLLNYLPVIETSIADRTLMLWMQDGQEQAFIRRIGWSGGLNQDPENPAAGVYFNNVLASKLGWYVLMDTRIGEQTRNEDGSYTYPVSVTFFNIATKEEMDQATGYISGGRGGTMIGVAYFFAPAGGTVRDFAASNGQTVLDRTYHGLQLGFMDEFLMKPDEPVTVTYSVTTAPGVETPLVFSKTPTAQSYDEIFGEE